MDTLKRQNSIPELPQLSNYRYENIFNVYQLDNGAFFYNINRTITIPDDIDKNAYYTTITNGRMPWTTISYRAYGTMYLWWLIAILNKVKTPLTPPTGTIKIIRPEYISTILSEINKKI